MHRPALCHRVAELRKQLKVLRMTVVNLKRQLNNVQGDLQKARAWQGRWKPKLTGTHEELYEERKHRFVQFLCNRDTRSFDSVLAHMVRLTPDALKVCVGPQQVCHANRASHRRCGLLARKQSSPTWRARRRPSCSVATSSWKWRLAARANRSPRHDARINATAGTAALHSTTIIEGGHDGVSYLYVFRVFFHPQKLRLVRIRSNRKLGGMVPAAMPALDRILVGGC